VYIIIKFPKTTGQAPIFSASLRHANFTFHLDDLPVLTYATYRTSAILQNHDSVIDMVMTHDSVNDTTVSVS